MANRKFVGRSNELEKIKKWIQRGSGGIVFITGAGGNGKTSLLQKITEEYSASDNFFVEYFDLAEQPATLINQAAHLSNTLGIKNFPEFSQRLKALELGFATSDSQEEAVNILMREISDYLKAQKKSLLRITDTYEIALKYNIYEDNWARGINDKLVSIPGTVFVIAGRDTLDGQDITEEARQILINTYGQENVLSLPLVEFNEVESAEFFGEFDEHYMIHQEMREKLHLLTNGRPVLLSLAVEWLQRNIPLPDISEKSLSELQKLKESGSAWENLSEKFEFELVSRVRQLQTPLDIATLFMAHIDRRMDSKLLSILLDINDKRADEILTELLDISFVKEFVRSVPPKCTLHDEMRELVKKHVWRYLDISGDERRHLTRKVIEQYYRPNIESLKIKQPKSQVPFSRDDTWERWFLETDALYYFSKLGENETFDFFDLMFYDREDNSIRDQFLLDELKRTRLNEDKIALREADSLRRHNQPKQARKILSKIAIDDLDDVNKGHAYNTLGFIDFGSNPLTAEKNFLKALELAVSRQDIQAQIHNNLGRLLKNTNQLDASIVHFKQAQELAASSGQTGLGTVIRNNLAATYRLNGNLNDADALCSHAIAENRALRQERPLAFSYLTKADIERDRGDLQGAERYAKDALDIFSKLDDDEGKAQAYSTLANIFRYSHDYEQALRYLRSGIVSVEEGKSPEILVRLYQSYGRTFRHYATHLHNNLNKLQEDRENETRSIAGLFQDARIALQQSIELSRRIENHWESARSQIELVLIMLGQRSYDESELNDLLNEAWQTANDLNDELLMGYVCENRAQIELRKGNYLEVGHEFGEMAWHLSNRTGQEVVKAFARLRNTLLDNEYRDTLAQGILERLPQQDCRDRLALAELIDTCEQIVTTPK